MRADPEGPKLPRLPVRGCGTAFAFFSLAGLAYWSYPVVVSGAITGPAYSAVGNLLFLALLATLLVGLVWPLTRRLGARLPTRTAREAFVGLTLTATLGGLFAGHVLGPGTGTSGGSLVLPLLSPFGLWPSLEFSVPSLHLEGDLSVPGVALAAVFGFLWSGLVALGWRRPAGPRAAGTSRATAAFPWLPLLTLNGGCCSGPYLLLLLVPTGGAAAANALLGFFGSPLGTFLDGSLLLGSFGLLAFALRDRARPGTTLAAPRRAKGPWPRAGATDRSRAGPEPA